MKKQIILIILISLFSINIFAQEQEQNEDTPFCFLNFQPIPGLNVTGPAIIQTADVFLLGTLVGIGYELNGIATSPIGSYNSGRVNGLQMSGVFNVSTEALYGVQISGIVNVVEGNIWGLQLAPVNIRGAGEEEDNGVNIMIGLVNVSKSPNVIPIGLINVIEKGERHFLGFMDDSAFLNAGYRSGSKNFYTHLSYGFGGGLIPGKEGDNLILPRGGFGFQYVFNKFYINVDLTRGNIKKLNDFGVKDIFLFFFGSNTKLYQIRFKAGYQMYERFGVFAGVSLDYLRRKRSSDPSPKDLGGFIISNSNNYKSAFKIGLFAGVQF